MAEKAKKLKNLHDLVRNFNKADDNTLDSTYGVCSEFLIKLAHYFSITIN